MPCWVIDFSKHFGSLEDERPGNARCAIITTGRAAGQASPPSCQLACSNRAIFGKVSAWLGLAPTVDWGEEKTSYIIFQNEIFFVCVFQSQVTFVICQSPENFQSVLSLDQSLIHIEPWKPPPVFKVLYTFQNHPPKSILHKTAVWKALSLAVEMRKWGLWRLSDWSRWWSFPDAHLLSPDQHCGLPREGGRGPGRPWWHVRGDALGGTKWV